jgi:hypothetical protein
MVFIDNSTETFEKISVKFEESKKCSIMMSEDAISQPETNKYDAEPISIMSPPTIEDNCETIKNKGFKDVKLNRKNQTCKDLQKQIQSVYLSQDVSP